MFLKLPTKWGGVDLSVSSLIPPPVNYALSKFNHVFWLSVGPRREEIRRLFLEATYFFPRVCIDQYNFPGHLLSRVTATPFPVNHNLARNKTLYRKPEAKTCLL